MSDIEEKRTEAVEESSSLEARYEGRERRRGKAKREFRDLFDVREVTEGARRVRVTEIPELGVTIKWCKLSFTEYSAFNKVSDVQERSYRTMAKMIAKANPDRAEAEILRMLKVDLALDEFAAMTMRMGREMASFLPPPRT